MLHSYLDVLLGVLKVIEQSIFSPCDSGLLVGSTVRVAIRLAGLTTKESVKIRALLVWTTFFDSVTLTALSLEDLGSLLFTHGSVVCRLGCVGTCRDVQ